MFTRCVLTAVIVMVLGAAVASASPGPFTWVFQDTGWWSAGGSSLAMRDGNAWPVIFDGDGSAYSLFPVTNPETGTNWFRIGSNLYPSGSGKAKSSPDGRVSFQNDQAAVVSSKPAGWTPLGNLRVAFDRDGALHTAQGQNAGIPGYEGGDIMQLAISPAGEIGIIDGDMMYHQYSAWIGWGNFDLNSLQSYSEPGYMDLEFDSLGQPHAIGIDYDNNNLNVYDFDIVTGEWNAQSLGTVNYWDSSELAASGDGKVGTAWVYDGTLYYAYKDGASPWTVTVVFSDQGGGLNDQKAGIEYDYAGLPVLSFEYEENYCLAYDPASTLPEPATMALLAIGGVGILVRRRRR